MTNLSRLPKPFLLGAAVAAIGWLFFALLQIASLSIEPAGRPVLLVFVVGLLAAVAGGFLYSNVVAIRKELVTAREHYNSAKRHYSFLSSRVQRMRRQFELLEWTKEPEIAPVPRGYREEELGPFLISYYEARPDLGLVVFVAGREHEPGLFFSPEGREDLLRQLRDEPQELLRMLRDRFESFTEIDTEEPSDTEHERSKW